MLDILSYYWEGMVAIFLVSSAFSFLSKKIGTIFSALITISCIVLSIFLMTIPLPGAGYAVGGYSVIVLGFILFPSSTWLGFILGLFIRRKKNR